MYGLKPKDTYKKALGRVLVGLPSQLGKQLVDDVCDRPIKLRGCCCHKAVNALWSNQLPVNICQHISNYDFNSDTYLDVFEAADKVYLSSRNVTSVAALTSAAAAPGFSINASENNPLNTAFSEKQQVSAVSKPPKKPKKEKKNKNQGQQGRKGPRHSSNPPHTCCDNHFVHGAESWFCQKPLSCPWKDKVVEKPA